MDNRHMLIRFGSQAMILVARLRAIPSSIPERAKQHLQPAKLMGEECIAAAACDEVMKPAVDGLSLSDQPVLIGRLHRNHALQVSLQPMQLVRVDVSARQPNCLTLESATDLTDFANFSRRHRSHNGPAIGQDIHQSHARQHDQRFADGCVTDAETPSQSLSHQVFAGTNLPVDDFLEQ
jgi:hypothetical protein